MKKQKMKIMTKCSTEEEEDEMDMKLSERYSKYVLPQTNVLCLVG